VQSPWAIKNPNSNNPNEEEVLKPVCFVFDFAPTRALRQLSEYAIGLSPNEPNAATAFFKRAIQHNGFPHKVVIDKSGANLAGLNNVNCALLLSCWFWLIEVLQVKYLNNIIEQDHRFIKKLTKQMKGFRSFNSAAATLEGIEVGHMFQKNQFEQNGVSPFKQFAALAG